MAFLSLSKELLGRKPIAEQTRLLQATCICSSLEISADTVLRPRELDNQHSLNMQTPTYLSTLKLHSEKLDKLVAQLEDEFPWQPVHPKEELPSIMYRAGQESVVQYIKQLLDED